MKVEDLDLPADAYEISRVLKETDSTAAAFVRLARNGSHCFVKGRSTPEGREGLSREVSVLSELYHPQIPSLKSADLDADYPYVILEFMGQPRSAEELRGDGTGTRQIAELCASALKPLAYLHQEGLTHRDVKTDNLVIRRAGWAALVDYELSLRDSEEDFQPEETVYCTPYYAAPERLEYERGDARSDIYSMGVVMYQLLYQRLPVLGIELDDSDERSIPDQLVDVVERATQLEPDDRYESAEAMGEAITEYLRSDS